VNFKRIFEKSRVTPLKEMAVLMGPNDGYDLVITVASGYKDKTGGQKKEHNPPHAHIYSVDKSFESRFRIDSETPPTNESEIALVNDKDASINNYAKTLVEWFEQPSKRYHGTNWEAMRQAWRDIQDVINVGLSQPWYI
jgi:hypothetical protein